MKKFLVTLVIFTGLFSLTSCGLQNQGVDDEAVRRTQEEMVIIE